ncbi:MAG: VanZ family protein [Nitrospirae bacterium]|nr:VanZ family protein [Nitrospirota bacterium]
MLLIILWLLLILFFSVVPVQGLQTGHPTDKIAHFIIYGLTALLFFRFLRRGMSLIMTTFLSILFSSLYGFLIELIQHTLPWREFSLLDGASNLSGAIVFSAIYAIREYKIKNQI